MVAKIKMKSVFWTSAFRSWVGSFVDAYLWLLLNYQMTVCYCFSSGLFLVSLTCWFGFCFSHWRNYYLKSSWSMSLRLAIRLWKVFRALKPALLPSKQFFATPLFWTLPTILLIFHLLKIGWRKTKRASLVSFGDEFPCEFFFLFLLLWTFGALLHSKFEEFLRLFSSSSSVLISQL